ncbi:hypothetical protein [Carnobacterium divergens]|uniref:hypothetical protein n=1 Tax=Carnobacterium divergens TaxID=2748 RepID=UPI0028914B2D|nr:hypothetical protein [Carnobacterium divergens]MDT2011158.1 hypothetical protein [Carnobacterium divergens]
MTVNVSLTQFLTYTSKVSTSARINFVRSIKSNPEYDPTTDFWKRLRDEIKRVHVNDLPIETLELLPKKVTEKKVASYERAIKNYIKFCRNNSVQYFKPGKSFWKLKDDLYIRTSPELGLIINGNKYYVKNYYKKKSSDQKITLRNIKSTLTMMQISEKDFTVEDNAQFAVLNLQNSKLITADPLVSESVLELEIDATNFYDIYTRI